jgi:hypothetical protein
MYTEDSKACRSDHDLGALTKELASQLSQSESRPTSLQYIFKSVEGDRGDRASSSACASVNIRNVICMFCDSVQ